MRTPMRIALALLTTTTLVGLGSSPAFAASFGHRHHSHQDQEQGDGAPDPNDSGGFSPSDGLAGPVPTTRVVGPEQTINAEITGYSYQDNTPAGSATISMPVLHRVAGGTGTFADPITTATPGSASDPETPKGTKLYVAKLRRYFIVEDSGATKEGGRHFDLYVDGQGFSKADSDACMDSYTGDAPVILNPPPGEPVTPGALTGPGGCRTGGSTPTTDSNTGVRPAAHARTSHAKSTHAAPADQGDTDDDN